MKKVVENIFLKLMFNILKKLHDLHNDLLFLPEKMKIEKVKKLAANLHDTAEWNIYRYTYKKIKTSIKSRISYIYQKQKQRKQLLMNKPIRNKSIQDFQKFWYDYVKPNYNEKPKLSYMNTDIVYSFTVYIKT